MLNDLPDEICRMEIISADLAALALTGLIKAGTVMNAKQGNYYGWETAVIHKSAIINAVRNASLQAYSVTIERETMAVVIPQKSLQISDFVTDVEVFSRDLWLWLDKPNHSQKNIDPLAELNKLKAEFVSLKEIFDILKNNNPHMKTNDIAEWMIGKLCHENDIQVYSQGLAGKLHEEGNDYYGDDNPFLKDLLERVMTSGEEAFLPQPVKNPPPLFNDFDDDIPF